jgi:hypothetical protein
MVDALVESQIFKIWAAIETLQRDLNCESDLNRDTIKLAGTRTCETCGCLMHKSVSTKGKTVIKIRPILSFYSLHPCEEEYMYTPYYCRVHAPSEQGGPDVG